MKRTDNHYQHRIHLEQITHSELVIAELEQLSIILPASNLYKMTSFNNAYIVVSKHIRLAQHQKTFKDPPLVHKLEINFAKQYFLALNQYAHNGTLPHVWKYLGDYKPTRRLPWFVLLLIGAYAHIVYDLPLVLINTIARPEEFQNDYDKFNNLLLLSSRDIAKNYYNFQVVGIQFSQKFTKLYERPVMNLIFTWRTKAWQELLKVQSAQ